MALQSSGAIKLSEVQTEFGGSNPISLSEYYSAAGGIPASGVISISDFYGTANAPTMINDRYVDYSGFMTTTTSNIGSYGDNSTYYFATSVYAEGTKVQPRLTFTGDENTVWPDGSFDPADYIGRTVEFEVNGYSANRSSTSTQARLSIYIEFQDSSGQYITGGTGSAVHNYPDGYNSPTWESASGTVVIPTGAVRFQVYWYVQADVYEEEFTMRLGAVNFRVQDA